MMTIFCPQNGASIACRSFLAGSVRHFWRGHATRAVLFFGLVWVLLAALWPIEPAGRVGDVRDAEVCRHKAYKIWRAQSHTTPLALEFSENEVNAYLAVLVARQLRVRQARAGEKHPGQPVEALRMEFTSDTVRIGVRMRYGSLPISYEMRGRAQIGDGGFSFVTGRVRLGHLPLPGLLNGRVESRFSRVFINLGREAHLLFNLKELRIRSGMAQVVI